MNLLVIDTSTDQPALGLVTDDGRTHVAPGEGCRRHGRDLIPALRDLLTAASLPVTGLDVIAVGLGPGSYTGLRIGLTAARILAYAASAEFVGVDSLEGWARTASPEALDVHVVADAQRGDVYSADFTRVAAYEPLARASVSRIEPITVWSDRVESSSAVVGPGLDSLSIRAAIPATLTLIEGHDPRSSPLSRTHGLLELALQLWREGHRDDLWTLEPCYLRRSAAEDQWDARAGGEPVRKARDGP